MKIALGELLKNLVTPMVADGGMATSLYDKGFYFNRSFEELSLTHEEVVKEVSAGFLRAGAQFLSTNTFGALYPKLSEYGLQDQIESILKKSVEIAKEVADDEAYVLGAIGPLGRLIEPLGPTSVLEAEKWFQINAKHLHDAGVDGFSILGFHDLKELECAISSVKKISDRPIFAHVSIQDNQKTNYGHSLQEFVTLCERLNVEAVGIAGEVGPSGALTAVQTLRSLTQKPVSVLPNAGFPRYINDQYIYLCNPDYIGKYAKRYVQAGAQIIGGHSGVGDQHIKAISNSVRMTQSLTNIPVQVASVMKPISDDPQEIVPLVARSKLGNKLSQKQTVISVEINPPRGVDCDQFLKLCERLSESGVEFVNIPDGARAVARLSSLQVSSLILRKYNLEPIPHFTSRDRNLIGLQSDLLGAHVNGVRNVLLVTGDPPKLGNSPGATGVYDVDAIGMTHIVSRMNQGLDLGGSSFGRPTEYVVGVALNPTAHNIELEIERLKYKIEAGANFIMTQPIYDVEAYRNFFERVGPISVPIVMGIWPLVSLRNAEFLKNEVPGVSVPDWVIEEMEKAGDSKEKAVQIGLEIAIKTVQEARNMVAGFQVSAPFNRIEVALEVVNEINRI